MGRIIELKPKQTPLSYEDSLAIIYNALIDSESILQVIAHEIGDPYFVNEAAKAGKALEIFRNTFM